MRSTFDLTPLFRSSIGFDRMLTALEAARRFEQADHVRVTGASLVNGLLTIELGHEIPEEMKPRRIEIAPGTARPRQIGDDKRAA